MAWARHGFRSTETMFKILGKNGLRTSAFALACFALAGMDVKASAVSSPIELYNTKLTSLDTTTVTGTPEITYTPAAPPPASTGQTTPFFSLNSNVGLGSFNVSAPPDGTSTTYNNTP